MPGVNKYKICTIGDRVLSNKNNITCTPEGLAQFFCNINGTAGCVDFYNENKGEIREELAIPGLASGAFWKNFMPKFRDKDDLVSLDNGKYHVDKSYLSQFNYIFVDITSSFAVLVSIYFPSCTGILAGSNRSGDLADAQKAIPLGTLAAQLTTSFVYLSVILLFGASFNPLFIRDKFGESLGKELAVSRAAAAAVVVSVSDDGDGAHSLDVAFAVTECSPNHNKHLFSSSPSLSLSAGHTHLLASPDGDPGGRPSVHLRCFTAVLGRRASTAAGHCQRRNHSIPRATAACE